MKRLSFVIALMFAFCLSACAPQPAPQEPNSSASPSASAPASQTPSGQKLGVRKNPAPLNTTVLFDGMKSYSYTFKTELTLTEVIRGDAAFKLVKDGNKYNKEPEDGMEYMLAKFKINALESKDDEKVDINNSMFNLVSQAGNKYEDFISVSGLKPALADMYSGATQEGYAYFMVKKDDSAPSIVFLESQDSGIWFATDPNAKAAEGSAQYTPSASSASSGTSSSGKGTRKTPYEKGETASFDGMKSYSYTFKAELTLTETVRGDAAYKIVKAGNKYNKEPDDGMEYLLAKFKINALESKDDEKVDVNNSMFSLVSQAGNKYEGFFSVSGLKPALADMYSGATQEGYAYFMVKKDDAEPSIVFLESQNSGIWFSAK